MLTIHSLERMAKPYGLEPMVKLCRLERMAKPSGPVFPRSLQSRPQSQPSSTDREASQTLVIRLLHHHHATPECRGQTDLKANTHLSP